MLKLNSQIFALFFALCCFAQAQTKFTFANDSVAKGIIVYELGSDIGLMTENKDIVKISKANIKDTINIRCELTTISSVYIGYVVKYHDSEIKFQLDNGTIRTFKLDVIKKFRFIEEPIKDKELRIGFSAGLPTIINLNVSLSILDFGFGASVGYFPFNNQAIAGAQGNFYYIFDKSDNFRQHIGLAFGMANDNGTKEVFEKKREPLLYVGPYYEISYYGLFVNLGFAIRDNNKYGYYIKAGSNYFTPIGQIGYMFAID